MVTPCDRLRACRYYVLALDQRQVPARDQRHLCSGFGDYPPLCLYSAAPCNEHFWRAWSQRAGLYHEYVGGMKLLWRHQAAYVPLCNASCGRVMGRGPRRQGNVCEFILRQVICLFRRVAAIIWPLNRCITLSGNGIGSRQLRRKGSGRSLCPPPCNLSEPTHGYDVLCTESMNACVRASRARRLRNSGHRWLFSAVRTWLASQAPRLCVGGLQRLSATAPQ